MTPHEGQIVTLAADVEIADDVYLVAGTSGYAERTFATRVDPDQNTRHQKSNTPGGWDLIVLVHFVDACLRTRVPAALLEEAPGS